MRKARRGIGIVSAAVLVWALLPVLLNGIVNTGVVASFLAGLFGLAWGFSAPPQGKRKGWRRTMAWILWTAVGLLAALFLVMSTAMVTAALRRPPAAGDSTVLVLGARINGDQPSRMLRNRLDAAVTVLDSNPAARCIVSGGLGAGEQYTEAQVMKRYLVAQGIAPERIYEEGRSTDTHENIAYSLELIRQHGLSERVVIATQEFHQYRAATLARRAGLTEVTAATCLSPPHLLLCYWVRECAAIARLWVWGY